MSRPLQAATFDDVRRIARAADDLRSARDDLKQAGARQAARYVSRALKSVEGALRHAYRRCV